MFKIDPFTACMLLLKMTLVGCGIDVCLIAFNGFKKVNRKLATSKLGNKKDLGKLTGDIVRVITKVISGVVMAISGTWFLYTYIMIMLL